LVTGAVRQLTPQVEGDARAVDALAIHAGVTRLALLWDEPALPALVTVRLSTRLRTALGLCRPASGRIVLNAQQLAATPALLPEVLCHELAHVVVHRRHGRRAVPHGPEWQALVRAAGYTPSTALRVTVSSADATNTGTRPRATRSRTVLHHCPVCHTQRLAKRAVRQWRCAECQAAGLEGQLEITPLGLPATDVAR
jgi:predicted SprT family Zn-dependent metalloprotease